MIISDWNPARPEEKKNDNFSEEDGNLSYHIPIFEISHKDA